MKRIKTATRKSAGRHNSALTAKVGIRRWLVEQLGGQPNVLDCFCAAGMLWERAYAKTPNYLGLDLRQFDDARRTIVTDSRRCVSSTTHAGRSSPTRGATSATPM